MFAIVCRDNKINSLTSICTKEINDIQSIFDIIYNTTTDYDLAMECYSRAGNMHSNEAKKVLGMFHIVTLVCYDETKYTVDNTGSILSRHTGRKVNIKNTRTTKTARVYTPDEVIGAIRKAKQNETATTVIAFQNDNWRLRVAYSPDKRDLSYFADYSYKNGQEGTVRLAIANNFVVSDNPKKKVLRAIKAKVLTIDSYAKQI